MTKLKLGPLADDRPVKLSVELPAAVHRDLQDSRMEARQVARDVDAPKGAADTAPPSMLSHLLDAAVIPIEVHGGLRHGGDVRLRLRRRRHTLPLLKHVRQP